MRGSPHLSQSTRYFKHWAYFIFSPHLTNASALHGKQSQNCVFSLQRCMLFYQQTQKTKFILSLGSFGHSWAALHSHQNRPYRNAKQDLGRKHIMLLSVATHSSFTKSVVMSSVSCSLCSLKWKVDGQYWWESKVPQNGRFRAQNAPEPPNKIWRR